MGRDTLTDAQRAMGVGENLVRISVGLDDFNKTLQWAGHAWLNASVVRRETKA